MSNRLPKTPTADRDVRAAHCRRILECIDGIAGDLKEKALAIHARPELGFEETFASSLWADLLAARGFAVERGVAGLPTAFRAASGSGPVAVAFMLEYDALPGIGHGCGHHLNGAAACGAAIGLQAVAAEVGGRVLALGSPGEEGLGGKIHLLEAGLLDGVACALMAHASNKHTGAYGHSAVAKFRVTFHGRSAHAASVPHEAINALDAMIQLFNGVAAMRQQMRDRSRVHGVITDGGRVPNVIPDRTEALFYLRDRDDAYLRVLEERFRNIVAGSALQTGTRAEIEPYGRGYKSNIPNSVLDRLYQAHLSELGCPVGERGVTSAASTDMGDVSHRVPAIHPGFKAAPVGTPGHSRAFAAAGTGAEALDGMVVAAKALALTGYDVISDPPLRQEMQEAWQREVPGRPAA